MANFVNRFISIFSCAKFNMPVQVDIEIHFLLMFEILEYFYSYTTMHIIEDIEGGFLSLLQPWIIIPVVKTLIYIIKSEIKITFKSVSLFVLTFIFVYFNIYLFFYDNLSIVTIYPSGLITIVIKHPPIGNLKL